MTRKEHLDWAKQRALEYVEGGDPNEAFASMTSDLHKHPELQDHAGIELGTMLLMTGHLGSTTEMRTWIEGFN
jgi:hypothetical protein